MILYHGTNVDFETIDLNKTKPYKDFGRGFYVTDIREQAVDLAKKRADIWGGSPVVQEYVIDESYPYIFDKTTFASWIDYSTPVANENMALFDANGNIVFGYEKWECDNPYVEQDPKIEVYEQTSYAYKTVNSATFKLGNVSLEIRNISNVDLEGDYLVNYYTTHPSGQVAGLDYNNILVTSSGNLVTLEDQNLYALKQSTGNKNVFTFLVKGGLKGGLKKH